MKETDKTLTVVYKKLNPVKFFGFSAEEQELILGPEFDNERDRKSQKAEESGSWNDAFIWRSLTSQNRSFLPVSFFARI